MKQLPVLLAVLLCGAPAYGSDHLDTAAVIADPAADIGDLYAWTSADGRRLNLVMTIVGGKFSDHVRYQFHVDSGRALGTTTASLTVSCEFNAPTAPDCRAGDADHLRGEAGDARGIEGVNRRFRVFAGARDDPFFNNVRGTRAALNVAAAAMRANPAHDSGCPRFDAATSAKILAEWRHTDGGPGANFLAGWKTAALVVEMDLDLVTGGGPLLAVWATTVVRGVTPGHARVLDDGVAIDRMGRALTGNMLLGTFDTAEISDALKSRYNQARPEQWPAFATDLAKNLAIYDAFDGRCGNQWRRAKFPLATLLADDRLWVNSASRHCTRYLAVELGLGNGARGDCGGRRPDYDAVDVMRSRLMNGKDTGLADGVEADDAPLSPDFPFLAP